MRMEAIHIKHKSIFVERICWQGVSLYRQLSQIILTTHKTYQYDAFGVEKNIDDTDTNAFRYCGEYYDKETATIYLRARYYSPSTGRFISRDSFAGSNNDPLSLNLYTYCHNNPVSGTDSTGHFLDTFFDAASLAFDIVSFSDL